VEKEEEEEKEVEEVEREDDRAKRKGETLRSISRDAMVREFIIFPSLSKIDDRRKKIYK
jgi:hypothetical protein